MKLDPNDKYYRILPINNSEQNAEEEQKPKVENPEDKEIERPIK